MQCIFEVCFVCLKELCSTLEAKEDIYKQLLQRGQQILALTPEGQDSSTEMDLRNLQEKWKCVQAKVAERKVRENISVPPVSVTHHHQHRDVGSDPRSKVLIVLM